MKQLNRVVSFLYTSSISTLVILFKIAEYELISTAFTERTQGRETQQFHFAHGQYG